MKKQLLFILALPLVMFLTSCSEKKSDKISFSSAIEYNDFIINLQSKTIKEILILNDNMKSGDSALVFASFDKFGAQAKASYEELKKLDTFKKDGEFRDKSLDLFKFYVRIYEVDYKEMIGLVMKKDISKEDLARIDEIVDKVSLEETKLDEGFANAQQIFATKHNLKMKENKLQKEIDKQ